MQNDIKIRESIKAVMFDLGNVLLFFSHQRMFRQIATELNCDVTVVEDHLKTKGNLHRLEAGLVLASDFLRDLNSSCSGHGDLHSDLEKSLRRAMSDIFIPNRIMIDLLQDLQKKGIKLVLVSNTSSIHFDFVKSMSPWLNKFDALVLSYEIKAMKPDSTYYQAVLKVAKERPKSCVFVDDIAENISGAANAGFQTHQYVNHDGFLRFLSHSN